MLNLLTKGFAKLFGTKSEKDIKAILPYVEATNRIFDSFREISNDELRAKTGEVKARIDEFLSETDKEITKLHRMIDEQPDMDINEKEETFAQIDKLEEERNEKLDEVLLEVLPDAFAIVKETTRRFNDNERLEVAATMHDKQYASKHDHVEIHGEKAIWHNKWIAGGTEITWDMVHYDVQIVGGVVLHEGNIAEMATGEGKTLAATLPAFLNALAKRGVHIVTVNNYLATRDAAWMGPIFEFHGISVDCIDKYEPHSEERRAAYNADITYGTNNEFGFDYLRDNMSREPSELVQRQHHFVMVDEVDSVLIDEARTPLIISGPIPKGDEHEFYELKPRIQKLVDAQKKLLNGYLQEAKKFLADGDNKEGDGALDLFRVYRGLPKYKPLIKYLSETGIRQILQKTENFYLQDNQKMMPEADKPLYFTIDEKHNSIDLTDRGIDLITDEGEDQSFFIMPDIGSEIANMEKDESLSPDDKLKRKEEIISDYAIKGQRIHSVNQLLKAYCLFEKDTEYIIDDSKIKIVDEQTGRVMEGRRYSDGLHQALEAKENVKVEDATQTYATITLQNYFRMYQKLSGMTGTAETEAGEFWKIYKLDVVVIPSNKPITRVDVDDKVYKTIREKYNAVVDEIVELREKGRPVLVGTTSVEISELLSRMLHMKKIDHQVLNAKQHQHEAEVVAHAGESGTVTIATNMAGRGTDIKLTPESRAAGGLAIAGTERHESRRVDRQLRGRSGRQGDPGSSQFFVSLEDNLMRLFMPERIARVMDKLGLQEGEVIQHSMVTKSIERAQKKVEENNFGIRKRLLDYDDVMNSQREVIYKRRKHALFGERLQLDIMNMLWDTGENLVLNGKESEDYDGFKLNVISVLSHDFSIGKEEFLSSSAEDISYNLYNEIIAHYKEKNKRTAEQAMPILKDIYNTRGATIENILVPFSDGKKQIGVAANLERCIESDGRELIMAMEKIITLAIIDQLWKEHLRDMDDLKQSVQNAVYEQKDPLLIYKFEAFELFKKFVARVNEDTSAFLMKAEIPVQQPEEVHEARTLRRQKLQESKAESSSLLSGGEHGPPNRPAVEKGMPLKSQKVAGRNQRVSVQYASGKVVKDVKFKTVEDDIRNSKCVMIDN